MPDSNEIIDDLIASGATEFGKDEMMQALDETRKEVDELRAVLDATHKLITEGALVGFIPTEGTWAERLYANQGQIHDTLNKK